MLNPVSESEIFYIIAHMDETKSAGPSNISTKFLRQFIDLFTPILTKLVNKSFINGVFPDILKIADVVPVYKKMTNCNAVIIDLSLSCPT